MLRIRRPFEARSLWIAAAVLCAVAPSLPAQEADGALEEILVTARKRSESLQDVPISISAVSRADLVNKSAVRLEDALGSIANVAFESDSLGGTNVNIRGITSSTNNFGIETAVGLYVDEVYLSRPTAFNQSTLDIERIEVLRGPQGTLFGRNTVGGVISVVTADPTTDLQVGGDATLGNDSFRQFRGTASGPMGDKAGFRLSVSKIDRDGWLENRTPGLEDLAGEDSTAVRAKVKFAPTDTLDVVAAFDYAEDKSASGINEIAAGPLAAFDDGINDSIATNIDNRETRKMRMATVRANLRLGDYTLTSVSGYQKIDYTRFNDQDYTALDILATGSPERDRFFSQELRLASPGDGAFDYVAGVYYSNSRVEGDNDGRLGADVPVVLGIGSFPGYTERVVTSSDIDSKAYALFGSGTYDFSDRWSLSAGLRYTDEKKTLDYQEVVTPFFLAPGVPLGIIYAFAADVAPVRQDYDDNAMSGDLSLAYEVAPQAKVYGRYARGYKAGGFDSTQSSVSDPGNLAFQPEFVDQYELGLKSQSANRRVQFNAAAFYMSYDDKQEQTFDGFNFLTTNAASATIQGAEAELSMSPVQGLRFDLALGYTDATYDEFIDPLAGSDYSGNDLVGAARWSGSAGATYSFPLSAALRGMLHVESNYRSSSFTTTDNDPAFRQDGHNLVNARIGIEDGDGRYGLYVWGKNITDERYVQGGFNFLGNTFIRRNVPESWGIEIRAQY